MLRSAYFATLIDPPRSDLIVRDPDVIYSTGYGDTLYYIELFEHSFYFYSSPLNVLNAEYHANRNMVMRGYETVEELLQFFGIPEHVYKKIAAEDIGWEQYTLAAEWDTGWLDFTHGSALTRSGTPLVVISAYMTPYRFGEPPE